MDISDILLATIKGAPTFLSVTMSAITLGLFFLYHKRKSDIDEKNATNNAAKQQIEVLMHQLEVLSNELTEARKQLTEIHDQNIKLMEQLRKANIRISELEVLLAARNSKEL